jgi:hypothetical protein
MEKSKYIVKTVPELDSLTKELKARGYTLVTFAHNLRELKKDDHFITIIRDKNA